MDHIEKNIQTLMKEIKEFNYIEFYHEHYNLQKQIRDIKASIKTFNVYMPRYSLKVEDLSLAIN